MVWGPLQMLIPKRFLGIDIGTSYIKIAEISRFGHRKKLENYGTLSATVLYERPFRTFEKSSLLLSSQDIARAIKAVIEEAKIKSSQAFFSIPDFSTFFTNFELPQMSKEELEQAVRYEARSHVPLPLNEVTLDWQIIEGQLPSQKDSNLKILLVAVPNEVINQYREIAQLSQLELIALEAEVFALKRTLIAPDERRTVAIIDIGAQSTTCNIIDRKTLKISYSFDMSGNDLTAALSQGLDLDYERAEDLKEKYGISSQDLDERGKEVRQILLPLIDIILREIEKTVNNFFQKERKEVEKIIIAGGSAFLPGLKEYFGENFKKEIEIASPFFTSSLFYPPILENKLKEMGPGYAIAVGLALRGLEY